MPMRTVVAVPARLASSRLPGKVLADIGGKPMLRWVLEACLRAESPVAVVLCSDAPELIEAAAEWGCQGLLTSPACSSGSDRIASVVVELVALAGGEPASTLVVNVQGDQPFLDPGVIDAMSDEFARRSPPVPEVLTPVYRMGAGKVHNPNVVKTLVAHDGRALYFSRSAIPHVRGVDPEHWHAHVPFWGHVGIYGYRADVLARWPDLPASPLEESEKLEQLRLLEAGIGIGTFPVAEESLSVDTAEQLQAAREIAAAAG